MHIFDNDNFSIIPKSIFFDNDNLPISCKNADISAIDNFFNNIAHPYDYEMGIVLRICALIFVQCCIVIDVLCIFSLLSI